MAHKRQQLTLFRHPVQTLRYFSKFVWQGAVSSTHWFISHPLTIFLLVPVTALYLGAKYLEYAPQLVATVEVRCLLASCWVVVSQLQPSELPAQLLADDMLVRSLSLCRIGFHMLCGGLDWASCPL
jgi:hypothetical protein